jgi:RNA polymerase sigma factor (TIGR02999 family)
MSNRGDVTQLLQELGHGGRAVDDLLAAVYDELRRVARHQLSAERSDHTLQPTALVHEAYLRLSGLDRMPWSNRSQFFAVAARAMRRVLVDHALARRALKRGGGQTALPLDEAVLVPTQDCDQIIALHEALEGLERMEPRLARVVECRWFAGLTVEETADALGISAPTVKRDWSVARAWLHRELTA